MFPIASVNIGIPRTITYADNRKLKTSMMRSPVKEKVFLDLMGFDGDQVADPVNHGGRDKAVCGYPASHYEFWVEELSRNMPPASFGENLTIEGLSEDQIHIGDIFKIGEAEVQCSQPRQPCHKLTKIFDFPKMASRLQILGYSGYYFRVLKQGWIQAGMMLERTHSDQEKISVLDAHYLMYRDKTQYQAIEKLVAHPAISESWRNTLSKRLANHRA